jgi:predicted transcriptional regulator
LKPRAGIIGPNDSVQLISEIATEYSDRLQSVPFIYQNPEEATSIVQKNQHAVDLWILAGPALFNPFQKSAVKQPFFLLQLDGASLTKTLVDISYNDKRSLERISIDTLTERDVYETYRDLSIPSNQVYVHEYTNETPLDNLLAFHQKHIQDGKVDICITSLRSIYDQLCLHNITAYWVSPTRSNIRETLSTALQQWETMHFKHSQIAAILVKVQGMEKKEDHNMVSYDLHRLNLEIQAAILNFAESISGSFVTIGTGIFVIFSTRGSLEETENSITSLLEKLSLLADLPSNIGIGYGDTALTAEENARLALNHAQNYDSFCAFLVDNNGTIEGPLKEQEAISYQYRTENKDLSEKLKNSGITITTFNKILSVQKRMGNGSITATHIAEWLKMTPRNARRILTGLVEEGIAEIIGDEAPSSKGRPRKIYRVSDTSEMINK